MYYARVLRFGATLLPAPTAPPPTLVPEAAMPRHRMWLVLLALGAASPAAHAQTDPRVFFGNLHSHTSYSDGSGTPEQAYRHARDVGGLHFLAVTEHNHRRAEAGARERRDGLTIGTNHALYTGPQPDGLVPTARRFTEDGRFVALYGQEFSSISAGNHVNVFAVDEVIADSVVPNGRFDLLLQWLDARPDATGKPAVLQLNHPGLGRTGSREYGADDFASHAEWVEKLGRSVALIELLNGPAMTRESGMRPAETMERQYLEYLNRGFLLAPTGDQDNHYHTWGTATDARTAVIAERLTTRDLLEAMRARHVYATEDRNLELVFRVNGHLAGDVIGRLPPAGSALDITLTVHDPDEPDAAYEVQVFSDEGPGGETAEQVEAFTFEGDSPAGQPYRIGDIRYRGPGQYLFFKVRQIGEDGEEDRAWTAPVWFREGAAAPPAAAAVRLVGLLPNPAGDERQTEEVTVRNTGGTPVELRGWTVQDVTGQSWSLDSLGTLPAGAERTLLRRGQAMSLNNGGDTVALVGPDGVVVQSVTYPRIGEGERFTVQP